MRAEPDPASNDALARQQEAREVLELVMQKAARSDAAAVRAPKRRRNVGPLAIAALIVVGLGAWLVPSAWFVPQSPPISPQYTEASLCVAVYLRGVRVQQFARMHNRLPATLEEAGAEAESLTYERLSADRFRLVGTVGPFSVTFDSADSTSDFLESSLSHLTQITEPAR